MKSVLNTSVILLICVMSITNAQDSITHTFISKNSLSLQTINVPLWLQSANLINSKPDPFDSEVNYAMLAGIGGITLAVGTAVHLYQANAWWQQQGNKFRIVNDWDYALWIDKAGHFYGTNILAHFFSSGFDAANIKTETSIIYGAAAALAFQMYVEIEDGFGANWGFSPGDAGADILGAAFYVGRYYVPYLKNFQPRVSYLPSEAQKQGLRKDGNVIDDYDGQKYWLAIRMKQVLPKPIAKFWPSFLMISVGMGVRNIRSNRENAASELYISLDFDAETIPLHGRFWQFVKNTLNYFHFPMPGVRITPDAAFFVFTF